jgi:hypothetical protein
MEVTSGHPSMQKLNMPASLRSIVTSAVLGRMPVLGKDLHLDTKVRDAAIFRHSCAVIH